MSPDGNEKIEKEYLILCEGKDAKLFLWWYLESISLKDRIQVLVFDGNSKLKPLLQLLQNMEGFDQVTRILVIRDAETDAHAAKQSICNAFHSCDLPVPGGCNQWKSGEQCDIHTAYTLFPTCDKNPVPGALEDLCWSVLAEQNVNTIQEEIVQFIEKLKCDCGRQYPREFKVRLHTYFSVTDKLVSKKIGEAANSGAFDWNAETLKPLHEIILEGLQ